MGNFDFPWSNNKILMIFGILVYPMWVKIFLKNGGMSKGSDFAIFHEMLFWPNSKTI